MLVVNGAIIPVMNFSVNDESTTGDIAYVDQTRRLIQTKINNKRIWSFNFEHLGVIDIFTNVVRGSLTNTVKDCIYFDFNTFSRKGELSGFITKWTFAAVISEASINFSQGVILNSIKLVSDDVDLDQESVVEYQDLTTPEECTTFNQLKVWIDGVLVPCSELNLTMSNMASRISTIPGFALVNGRPSLKLNLKVLKYITTVSSIRFVVGYFKDGVQTTLWDSTYSGVGKLSNVNRYFTDIEFHVNS